MTKTKEKWHRVIERNISATVVNLPCYGSCMGCNNDGQQEIAAIEINRFEVRLCRECWKKLKKLLDHFV